MRKSLYSWLYVYSYSLIMPLEGIVGMQERVKFYFHFHIKYSSNHLVYIEIGDFQTIICVTDFYSHDKCWYFINLKFLQKKKIITSIYPSVNQIDLWCINILVELFNLLWYIFFPNDLRSRIFSQRPRKLFGRKGTRLL